MQQIKEYLPLIAALITVSGAIGGIFLVRWHKRADDARIKRDAAATIFLDAVTDEALRAYTLAIYIYQNLTNNVRAAQAFREFVPSKDWGAYDQAAKDYYAACEPHRNLGPLASLAVDLSPTADSDRKAIIDAIEKLRAFAK